MSFRKLKRSIEAMPRAPYIFLRSLLLLADAMLAGALLLFSAAAARSAVCLTENAAGVLLLGLMGFAVLLDRTL